MNTTSIRFLQHQAASLLLYRSVLTDNIGTAFLALLDALYHYDKPAACLSAYGVWFRALVSAGKSWQDYLIDRVLFDDNPFSQQVQRRSLDDLSPTLVAAAKQDLQALQRLYECGGDALSHWVRLVAKAEKTPVAIPDTVSSHRVPLHEFDVWSEALPQLAEYHRRHGCGSFARYRALRWTNGALRGIAHPDPVRLSDLAGYERQKAALVDNVKTLLAGYPTLHVLLYGCRGSGKSSLVKGVANEFGDRNLRLVEVAKSQLPDLPTIVERLRDVPQKFILFVDDLSFEEDDEAFKALKVVLEGSVTARASNAVVYATSNRRHLVREFFEDRPRPRDAGEVHAWDTMQEKLSFSDRFGLHLTFESANQDRYLEIVRHLTGREKLDISLEELDARALRWATQHNGRSGRTARQFVDFLKAELAASPPDFWA
ncbi:ATP-binding protein [Baaleninema simplex]|uniref:ATP-binding protein n=1 Tax=Baaleninema simplex TaxID=2862350 RepID=UPI00034BA570|nr:ATP-binding protein [Baaleninema simplex]